MPTVRRPRKAAKVHRITDKAVALFRQMRALPDCACVGGPNYWQCEAWASCEAWRQLHSELGLLVGD